MPDEVELMDCAIHIPADRHAALVRFIGEQFGHQFADLDEALGVFDLVAYYDGDGTLVDLDQEVAHDFAGPALFEALASCAQADDYLTFRQASADWTYRILFDGQGGYRRLTGSLTFPQ